MHRYTRRVASLATAAGIVAVSLLGPVTPSSAAVTPNDTLYYSDVNSALCGNNCVTFATAQTWSSAFAAPVAIAIVQKYDCSVAPHWTEIETSRYTGGGWWYSEWSVQIHNSPVCDGLLHWRLSVVNGS